MQYEFKSTTIARLKVEAFCSEYRRAVLSGNNNGTAAGLVDVLEDGAVEVLEALDLGLVGVWENVVQPVRLQVATRHDPETTVRPVGVAEVVAKENHLSR